MIDSKLSQRVWVIDIVWWGLRADRSKNLLNWGKDIGVLSIWRNKAVPLVRVGGDGFGMVSLLSFYTKWPGYFAEYNQQDATFHNLFISVRRATYFRRFFPSTIRSSKLRLQRQVFVILILLPAVSLTNTWCCMRSFELLMLDEKTIWNI